MTGGLNSGKQVAKANRKDLNKRAETLTSRVQEAAKSCEQICGGDIDGGTAEAKRLLEELDAADTARAEAAAAAEAGGS